MKRFKNRKKHKNLKKILAIKDRGIIRPQDVGFVKSLRYCKLSDRTCKKMVAKKSGPCETYIDESLIK